MPHPPSAGAPGPALHIIDPATAGPLALATLARSIRQADRVVLVGPRSCAQRARECGIHDAELILAPGALPERAWRTLSLRARAWPAPARICAWSAASLALARLAFPRIPASAILLTHARAPRALPDRWRRRALLAAADRALFASDSIAASWGAAAAASCAPPLPHVRWLSAHERARQRALWGAPGDTPIVAILGDPPDFADARRGMFLVGAMAIAGWPAHGVVTPDATGIERARRVIFRQRAAWKAIVEARSPSQWLGACDAVVALASRDAEQPLVALWAAGAGLPCVIETSGPEAVRSHGLVTTAPRGRVDLVAGALHEALLLQEGRERPAPTDQADDPSREPWLAALDALANRAIEASRPPAPALARWSVGPLAPAR